MTCLSTWNVDEEATNACHILCKHPIEGVVILIEE
jgi:hypothetical protein